MKRRKRQTYRKEALEKVAGSESKKKDARINLKSAENYDEISMSEAKIKKSNATFKSALAYQQNLGIGLSTMPLQQNSN